MTHPAPHSPLDVALYLDSAAASLFTGLGCGLACGYMLGEAA